MKNLVKVSNVPTDSVIEESFTTQLGLFFRLGSKDPIREEEEPKGAYLNEYGDVMLINGFKDENKDAVCVFAVKN